MSKAKIIGLIYSLFVVLTIVLFTHSMIKLPSEAFWSTPLSIYENYALAMALAFSLPAPFWTALLVLILIGLFNYWLAKRVLRWFGVS
ncbi:MAG: hypothetical protein Sapg2KO_52060 [Saprospiraceae bacterium]